jgi:L-fuculose-phosphate aldolase
MQPEDLPILNLHGQVVEGEFKPSSESPMHSRILRLRSDVNAIVHTHSPYATAFSVVHRPIPLICNEGLGTRAMEVLVAEYGVPGTEELGERVTEALDKQPGSMAVLIANHGLLTIGKSLGEAYSIASRVETEALICQLAMTIGTPVPLTVEQVHAIRRRYAPK